MTDSPGSTTKHSSAAESDTSSGFRNFWNKSKSAALQRVQFVQQEPGKNDSKSKRLPKFLRQGSSASTENGSPETVDQSTTAGKRRQQVYSAQKRYRNRKSEYVKTLEAEVARLQHLDAVVNTEKNVLAQENLVIKEFLASQSIDVQLESMSMGGPAAPIEDFSWLGDAEVDIRLDADIGHERTFLDIEMPDVLPSEPDVVAPEPADVSQPAQPQPQQVLRTLRDKPVKGDSWAALDFILALEWPCRDHIHHPSINPNAQVPKACDIGQFHGHALTATKCVYSSALPPAEQNHAQSEAPGKETAHHNHGPSAPGKWHMPHAEIDKLVQLSEQLELDDDQMTPAQAYAVIRMELPSDEALRPVLNSLKVPLSKSVTCLGLGAVMPAISFYERFDAVLESLGASGIDASVSQRT